MRYLSEAARSVILHKKHKVCRQQRGESRTSYRGRSLKFISWLMVGKDTKVPPEHQQATPSRSLITFDQDKVIDLLADRIIFCLHIIQ